jgi:2,3-bisphosphoglycerate-independent phosphoglycerate mutase
MPHSDFCTPLLLLILDGWGIANTPHGNAIAKAHTPQWDFLWQQAQTQPQGCLLQASGKAIGLPANQVGNSEIGHLTLGAGRTLHPIRVQIDEAIEANAIAENAVWQDIAAHLKQHKQATLHLVGLLSDGGVHSHLAHLAELLGLAKDEGLHNVRVHAIADGRDVPPFSVQNYLYDVEGALLDLDFPQISTVIGRFFAMDRDNRWHRTEQAFRALVLGEGKREFISTQAAKHVLEEDTSEEFIPPAITEIGYEGFAPNDVVFFWHFREDRLRQLAEALTNPQFADFDTTGLPRGLKVASLIGLGNSQGSQNIAVLFPQEPIKQTLGEVVATAGIRQLRVAETEKYPHVTYFFNGGAEHPFQGEERQLIPSPRHVETYDLKPEMALPKVTQQLVNALKSKHYGLIVANFANADMVGHTGNLPAAIAACEAVDSALEQVIQACKASGTNLLITADHGNVEAMLTSNDAPNTAHALSPVPFIWVPADARVEAPTQRVETLADVAPFVLKVMGLPVPKCMRQALKVT